LQADFFLQSYILNKQVLRCDHVGVPGHVTGPKFFEAQIILIGCKDEDEIIMTSTSMTISKKVIELDKEVMEKLSEWLKGSRLEEEEKTDTFEKLINHRCNRTKGSFTSHGYVLGGKITT
jgi:hypothetical protein